MPDTQISTSQALAMIASAINAPEDQVQPDTDLQDLEWWDSMGVLLLMAELDERFGIILEEETISSFSTVADILKILVDADALADAVS